VAHVARVVWALLVTLLLGQAVAVESVWPGVSELLDHLAALLLGLLARLLAGQAGRLASVLHALRKEHAARNQTQVGRAPAVNQGPHVF